jgi:hypothetical protein
VVVSSLSLSLSLSLSDLLVLSFSYVYVCLVVGVDLLLTFNKLRSLTTAAKDVVSAVITFPCGRYNS